MEKMLFTLTLAVLFTAVVGQTPCTGSYNPSGVDWSTEWTVSSDSLLVTFTVRARTDGWVGIGFSRDQMMPDSDVIIGAANANGSEFFISDRFTGDGRNAPLVDAYQNITDLQVQQVTMDSGTYTVMTFTRPICSNEPNDIALSENPYLLYAWGPVNNYDGDDRMGIRGHSDRGASAMRMDFICGATRGRYSNSVAGVSWMAEWEVTADAVNATFTLTASTDGWVAIGFSMNQRMADTDIVVGASDGAANSYVSDRYATGQVPPLVDTNQDIDDTSAIQMDMSGTPYTIVTFTRPTVSGDQSDFSLDNENGLYIMFAWGPELNFDETDPVSINIHTSRGVSAERINFFRCGVVLEPVYITPTPAMATPAMATPSPTAAGAAVSVTTALVLILVLVTLMNTLI